MKLLKYLILTILLYANFEALAQKELIQEKEFYFDAVVFKSDEPDKQRVDIYTIVPYQLLTFVSVDDTFAAKYELFITAIDSAGNRTEYTKRERSVSESDYFVTQGGTGKFDYSQVILKLPSGRYNLKIVYKDAFSNREIEKSRNITAIDFDAYDFSLSGLLLLSSIEERNGKYIITPHISDNVGNLKEGFFAFFEAYNNNELENVNYMYEILDGENKNIFQSEFITKNIKPGKNQQFININAFPDLTTGGYVLRVYALKPSDSDVFDEENILAAAQRSIKVIQTIGGSEISDMNEAIRQLRYVAEQRDIDFINEGETQDEKLRRFETFWKKLDPTPNTERNEAFDEYYARIAYANRNFGSYSRGWMTDKGMVYIILGPPASIDRGRTYADNKIYERWVYRSNREFIFVDNTGFGDYRLVRPIGITDKYKYSSASN